MVTTLGITARSVNLMALAVCHISFFGGAMKRAMVWGGLLLALSMGQRSWAEDAVVAESPTMVEPAAAVEQPASIVPSTLFSSGPFDSVGGLGSLGEVIGSKRGYIHPYLSIGETFTDNVFNVDTGKRSDFITRIIPGVWVALPARRFQPISLTTLNTAPGGLELTRFRDKGVGRFQAFAGYQADLLLHKRFDEEDRENHKAQALLSYNFRGGLSVEMFNVFEIDYDPYQTGDSTETEKFKSNLFNALISYEITPKTTVEAEYSFYTLSYSSDQNAFRERDDHRFTGRGFYRFMPRTSLIVEYNFINVDYDQDIQSDSQEHQFLAGVQWQQTAKSRWRLLAGYGLKDFDQAGLDEESNFLAEAQFVHRFTPKTHIQLRFSRRNNESDIAAADYILSHRLQLRYYQRILPNLLASVNLSYRDNDYKGTSRKDDFFGAGFDLRYAFTDWLTLAGGYEFLQRDSNLPTLDYDRNTAYLNLVFSL